MTKHKTRQSQYTLTIHFRHSQYILTIHCCRYRYTLTILKIICHSHYTYSSLSVYCLGCWYCSSSCFPAKDQKFKIIDTVSATISSSHSYDFGEKSNLCFYKSLLTLELRILTLCISHFVVMNSFSLFITTHTHFSNSPNSMSSVAMQDQEMLKAFSRTRKQDIGSAM